MGGEESCPAKEKTRIVTSLRGKFRLEYLLLAIKLPRSVYYYHFNKPELDVYSQEKELIKAIFHKHKGRYGYRRIGLELDNLGKHLNHKTVRRLMKELNLKSTVRPKRYCSYRGEIGTKAANILNRHFKANKPREKLVTDVTEFNVNGEKVYLSPIIDLYNQEVLAYKVAETPTLPLVIDMLKDTFALFDKDDRPILHSDQGWQYQHLSVRNLLKENNIIQSMSRKGNCLDNAVAENFFALLKTEMYHGHKFASAEELMACIDEYIYYYNHQRIKVKLNGLSPVAYRTQAFK